MTENELKDLQSKIINNYGIDMSIERLKILCFGLPSVQIHNNTRLLEITEEDMWEYKINMEWAKLPNCISIEIGACPECDIYISYIFELRMTTDDKV